MNVTVDLNHVTSNMIEKAEFSDSSVGFKCKVTLVDKATAIFYMCIPKQVSSFMEELTPEQIINNSSVPSLSSDREVIHNKELKGLGDLFKVQIRYPTNHS